jgi:hypothetical protein
MRRNPTVEGRYATLLGKRKEPLGILDVFSNPYNY